ncbi:MAG: M23 family metallopeptidase [Firmicutes bacterium]|nr:M23 family metallopeptidase [Bacillota bacterium]
MNQEQKKDARKLPSFYIALCCCVLVIGVAGYFTERQADKASNVISTEIAEDADEMPVFSSESEEYAQTEPTEDETVYDTADISSVYAGSVEDVDSVEDAGSIEDVETVEDVSAAVQDELTEEYVEEYAVENPDVEETAIIVSAEQPVFIMPVTGEILDEYSDTLVFNSALSDWRTHNGIDIAAESGCSVQAAADGVIDSVSEDAMGVCVTVSHAAGFVTKYMGLENSESLTEGKEIKSGEVIGTVGESKGDNVTESHLHLEITKYGINVNPSDYHPLL